MSELERQKRLVKTLRAERDAARKIVAALETENARLKALMTPAALVAGPPVLGFVTTLRDFDIPEVQ